MSVFSDVGDFLGGSKTEHHTTTVTTAPAPVVVQPKSKLPTYIYIGAGSLVLVGLLFWIFYNPKK